MVFPAKRIRIGTRGSRLALVQARTVAGVLARALEGVSCEIAEIRTSGDVDLTSRIADSGSTGLFVREIESELLAGRIDLAVHSLKDLPTALPEGLCLGAVLERADPRDVLVTRDGAGLLDLDPGASVATGSFRRQAQVLAARPDLRVLPVRGNLDTRIRKLLDGEFDALVAAAAGLDRLGDSTARRRYLDPGEFTPAPGQGAIGVEMRADDPAAGLAASALDHGPSRSASEAERAFIRRLGSGCSLPAGAFAEISGGILRISGFVSSPEGTGCVRGSAEGPESQAEALGLALAADILGRGGRGMLDRFADRSLR